MATRLSWLTGLAFVVVLAMARLDAGGWAVVTLRDVPDHLVAGRPVSLTYAVRQHGVLLQPGLAGWIEARDPRGAIVKTKAMPAADTGFYLADVTLPTVGEWTLVIHTGFMESKSAPIAIRVVDAASQAATLTAAERGKQLLAAKGCVACHTRVGFDSMLGFAPDLSSPRFGAAYLTTFLADPSLKAPSRPGLIMPNLQLSHAEIGALVAFLSVDATETARR